MKAEDFEKIPGFESRHEKLLRKLEKLSIPLTVEAIVAVDRDEFASTKGVGSGYVSALGELQILLSEAAGVAPPEPASPPPPDLDALREVARDEGLLLRAPALAKGDAKALDKLASHLEIDGYQVVELLKLETAALMSVKTFGRKTVLALRSLQERVVDSLARYQREPGQIPVERLFSVGADEDYASGELDTLIREDLDELLLGLPDRDRIIFMHRFGFGVTPMTLASLGECFGVSRERIRQLESDVLQNLERAFRITSDAMEQNLTRAAESAPLSEALEALARCFVRPEDFVNMLSVIANGHDFGVREGIGVDASPRWLEPLFARLGRPATREEIVEFLVGEEGMAPERAEGAVRAYEDAGALTDTPDGMKPTQLGKAAAVGYALASAKEAIHWTEVARRLREQRVSRTEFSTDRRPPALQTSEYAYLADRGTYGHVDSLDLDDVDDARLAEICRSYLDEHAVDAAALYQVFQARRDDIAMDDYYVFRHVIRHSAETYSLHFDGKSSTDTIARTKHGKRMTVEEQLARILEQSDEPMTVDQLAQRTLTGNTQFVQMRLGSLYANGRIVRSAPGSYQGMEAALDELVQEQLIAAVRSILERDPRPWDMSPMGAELNRELSKDKTYHWWMGVLRFLSAQGGWVLNKTLIGMSPPPKNGIKGVIIEIGWDTEYDELREEFQKRVRSS